MSDSIDRRMFLGRVAAVTLTVVAGCRSENNPERPVPPRSPTSPKDNELFPYGVQAGSMTAHSAIVWTYSTDHEQLRLLVWPEDQEPEKAVVDRDVTTQDGYCKVQLTQLEAYTHYQYGFMSADNIWSDTGRFTTAFGENTVAPILVGATACTASGRAPFPSLEWLGQQPLDVFCHLGDMSYNDGSSTIETFRESWSRILTNQQYRALLTSVGSYQTWDDHEITNDDEISDLDRDTLKLGKEAYFETTPTYRGPDDRIWTSYRWGASAEFFVLDCRQERDPKKGRYISQEQMDWLTEALKSSPCHFKVVLNSVPIALLGDLWLVQDDRWQGYPEQREHLLNFIVDEGIDNVWFLAGDFHMGAVWRVEPGERRGHLWEILCGPGGSAPSKRYTLASSDDDIYRSFFPQEQVLYASGDWAATTLLFDPQSNTVTVRFVDSSTQKEVFNQTISQSS